MSKTLVKYHDPLFATLAGATVTIDYSSQYLSQGWTQPTPGFLLSSNYIDLKGLSQEDETVFINQAFIQDSGSPGIAGIAGDYYYMYDIMTTIPVDWTATNLANMVFSGLGFPTNILNYEHVIYQRIRRFSLDLDTAANTAITVQDNQSGSGMPTASDRIYCYRLVIPNTAGGIASLTTQAVRYVLNVDTRAEPEFQYMMRLKRSYDLQNEPDRD